MGISLIYLTGSVLRQQAGDLTQIALFGDLPGRLALEVGPGEVRAAIDENPASHGKVAAIHSVI
jgi:hypothetical protein